MEATLSRATTSAPFEEIQGGARQRYSRRRPEDTVLYRVVQEHLESFLAEQEERGGLVPWFVEREYRRYLECGILARGFCRVRCDACGKDRLVAFSCKGRAICPSCRARRMADAAARLVEEVLPDVSYRQYTLSVPRRVRFRMAFDPELTSRVLGIFIRSVFTWQRRRARAAGVSDPLPAAATSLQRFGSTLNLHLHFHSIIPDGVFAPPPPSSADPSLRFVRLPPPEDEEVFAMALRIAGRVLPLVEEGADEAGESEIDRGWAAAVTEAVAPGVDSSGAPFTLPFARRRTALVDGFSLHADVAVAEGDREGLERLLRYGARPPFAHQRLELTAGGKVRYRLKRPSHTGQTDIVLEPTAFLRRLAMLVPPPRQNLLRFHGLLAPNAKWRPALIALARSSAARPGRPLVARQLESARGDGRAEVSSVVDSCSSERSQSSLGDLDDPASDLDPETSPRSSAYRLPWAALLRRVFAVEILVCPSCSGRMRLIAAITDPDSVERVLAHLGLPTEIPSPAPARAPPQPDLFDDLTFC